MRVLYAGFKGKTNSAKILLDKLDIEDENKLYLTNSFDTSVKELKSKLSDNRYDLIVAIGQLKLDKNVVRIERYACGLERILTNYDYNDFKNLLKENNFVVEESNKTNYLCNNIYYHGLKIIMEQELDTKMIFVHIPKLKNIDDIDLLASIFLEVQWSDNNEK